MKTVKDLKVGDYCYYVTPLRDADVTIVSEILENMRDPNSCKIKFLNGMEVYASSSSRAMREIDTLIFLDKDAAIEELLFYKNRIERHIKKLQDIK